MARRPQSAFSFQMPRLMPGVRALMIALGVMSISINAIAAWVSPSLGERMMGWVMFFPGDLWRGHIWELFTFTFYEGHPFGLLITGVMLWMFGTQLEEVWGTRRFLWFYFSTTALAALIASVLGLFIHSIAQGAYAGGWSSIEALVAGFALTFPTVTVFAALVLPIQARLLIPISLGVTLLFVVMTGSVIPFVVPVLALFMGVLLHNARGPKNFWLRLRVRWIERKMRGSKLRVVPGLPRDDELPQQRSGGHGSDGFLH